MASRGLRDLGDGPEKIIDTSELKAVRGAGFRVFGSALLSSVVATALLVAFPH